MGQFIPDTNVNKNLIVLLKIIMYVNLLNKIVYINILYILIIFKFLIS